MNKRKAFAALLALLALLLSGCRFAAVESGDTVVIAPMETEAAPNGYTTQT